MFAHVRRYWHDSARHGFEQGEAEPFDARGKYEHVETTHRVGDQTSVADVIDEADGIPASPAPLQSSFRFALADQQETSVLQGSTEITAAEGVEVLLRGQPPDISDEEALLELLAPLRDARAEAHVIHTVRDLVHPPLADAAKSTKPRLLVRAEGDNGGGRGEDIAIERVGGG